MKIGHYFIVLANVMVLGTIAWGIKTHIRAADAVVMETVLRQPTQRNERTLFYAGTLPSRIQVNCANKIILDPDFEGIQLEGDSAILHRYAVESSNSSLSVNALPKRARNEPLPDLDVNIRIGTQNMPPQRGLSIDVSKASSVVSSKPLVFDWIYFQGSEEVPNLDLNVDCNKLVLYSLFGAQDRTVYKTVQYKIAGRTRDLHIDRFANGVLDVRNLLATDCRAAHLLKDVTIHFGAPDLVNIRGIANTNITFEKEPKFKLIQEQ